MHKPLWVVALILAGVSYAAATDNAVLRERRQRAANAFHDGILLVHALSRMDIAADGYRQDAYFYYLTGLENAISAVFAIDGKSGILAVPALEAPIFKGGLKPPSSPAPSRRQLAIDHVVDWTELQAFLTDRAASCPSRFISARESGDFDEMPANLLSAKAPGAPFWRPGHLWKNVPRLRRRNRPTL